MVLVIEFFGVVFCCVGEVFYWIFGEEEIKYVRDVIVVYRVVVVFICF